ncbi:MAG: hypothetical protein GY845_29880 [Planctomycetes bacterium]|nr:hypothetical protein [Planctomycetota bacterium]
MDENIERFIDSANWVFAKTYAKTAPHEYAVREKNPDLEYEFIYFVKFIREYGYEEKFWSKTHTYYDVGEWKYWTMGNPVDETTIINRALIK